MDFDLKILCIDTASRVTGYAVFYVSAESFSFKLPDFGIVDTSSTDFGTDTDSRVRSLLSQIGTIACRHGVNCYVIEEPPETIYGWKASPKVGIVGRAAKMFKVVSAAYGLVGMCFSIGAYCRVVKPIHWQKGQAKNLGKSSKSWSVSEANAVLKHLKINRKLKTQDDENIADAINIGIFSIKKFASKEWELPSLISSV